MFEKTNWKSGSKKKVLWRNALVVKIVLMTCFFESFAIINSESISINGRSGFGFQFSWFVGIILVTIVFIKKLNANNLKFYKSETGKFLWIYLMLSILDFTYVVLFEPQTEFYIYGEYYSVNFEDFLPRGMVHCIYILICGLIAIAVYEFLREKTGAETQLEIVKKYFVTIPFVFICIWGVYQWLTTYDLIPYIKIFNNNVSTGFTYLRFKSSHRTSSVFPEPSEYGYFLGLYGPIVASFLLSEFNLFSIKQTRANKFWIATLYISQCLLTGSFSLFCVIPIIFLISINQRHFKRQKRIMYNVLYVAGIALLGGILYLVFADRIVNILNGNDGSVLERFRMLLYGIELFKKLPIGGTGYGTFRAMDHISGTLAYGGIIGASAFLFFLHKVGKISKKNPYANMLYKGYLCFVAVGCAGNNLYEFLPFWLIPILIESLCMNKSER